MMIKMFAVLRTACFIAGFALMTSKAFCIGTVTGSIDSDLVKVKADVVVYLKGVSGPVAVKHLSVDQHHMLFNPRVSTVPAGSTVVFTNNDKLYHNVFSISDTKKFSLDTYNPGSSRKVTFEKPGVVNLLCNVHSEMSGWIIVTENQYAAVSDQEGRFTITGVPAGTYEVGVWSETQKPPGTTTVTVTNGHTSQVHLTLGN
jgi:plastocyanin